MKETEQMTSPVVCSHCGTTYDLAAVKVTARYADATCFKTPCCNRDADDRSFKSRPDFTRVQDLRPRMMNGW